MSISNAMMSFPKPSYQYSQQTGLVKYVFVDFASSMQDEDYKKHVLTDYPYIVEFIQRQFHRICTEFGIKYQNFDDIRKIARDYIDFCKEPGCVVVDNTLIKRTEEEALAITTSTAGYDEKIEKWLQHFLEFLSDKKVRNDYIYSEKFHDELMFNVAFYIISAREVVLYLCGNYVMIEKIKQALDCIHQFMMDELTADEMAEITALRKETTTLMKMLKYNVDNIEDIKTFVPSDKNRFFMKKPNNVYSKHINELKKNKQYDPDKYTSIYFVRSENRPVFNMFNMPLVSTINKAVDEELRESILCEHAWSEWLVKFEDELAKYPGELARYVDLVKPGDYIHINPIFRYKCP
uniref:Uncharacterized protein n=1 Tax=viral metagenome TaxID=1070528 RepID=A0A6C0BTS7_9ZZZZ